MLATGNPAGLGTGSFAHSPTLSFRPIILAITPKKYEHIPIPSCEVTRQSIDRGDIQMAGDVKTAGSVLCTAALATA